MKYQFSDLIDIENNKKILDSFTGAVGIAAAIIDLEGEVIIGSRWQKICTDFHRVNEATCEKCIESDTQLANDLRQGKQYSIYRCRNGLTDAASPIIIEGEHIANCFVGQFFEKEPDQEFFRQQASRYGFEETAYLDALSEVSIVEEKKLPVILDFLTSFTAMIARMGLDKIKQMETQELIRESEKRLRDLLELLPEAVFETDRNLQLTFANRRASELFGYSGNDISQELNCLDLLIAEDHDRANANLATISRGEDLGTIEYRAVKKDGSVFPILFHATCIMKQDELFGFRGIIVDITERKQAEEALQENEKRYRELVDNAVMGFYQVDRDGKFVVANKRFAEIFGYNSPQEFLSNVKNITNLYVYPEERSSILKEIDENGFIERKEVAFKDKDGKHITITLNTRVTIDKNETVLYEGLLEDITEQKEIEKDRKQLQDQLQQAYKMEAIGTLAGGIAHDFNNILSPIIGNTELAMMDIEDNSPIQLNLKEIMKAGLRAKDLVQQILTFSRQKEQQKIPVRLSIIIKEISKLLRSTIPTNIDIRYDLSTESDSVLADSSQLHQVLLNLCTNASHAMREKGGVLEIELDELDLKSGHVNEYTDLNPGAYLRLTVSDTGYGMEPEIKDKIFEPYFTTKRMGEGTGIGLAVVHGIVKSHDGDIRVESQPGKGSSFRILFPKYEVAATEDTENSDLLPTGTEQVLLVDDEKAMVDVTESILVRLGYKVTTRTSSIEALEAFRDKPDAFDLVITDMAMPNMTGVEFARKLMSIRPDISIILCTGFSDQIDEKRAGEMGIGAFILKPIVMRNIAKAIREVLDK